MADGHFVIVLDNLFTGSLKNIQHWVGHPNFEFRRHDIIEHISLEVDQIYHLACPASPVHYRVSGSNYCLFEVECFDCSSDRPDQDHQDQHQRHSEHAGPRQAGQGEQTLTDSVHLETRHNQPTSQARMLLASSSDIYGDPTVHPQGEDYVGHVNPIGPRACYDEGKRVAETMM